MKLSFPSAKFPFVADRISSAKPGSNSYRNNALIDEGHRPEFLYGGEDGRVLADDRFLEQVLGNRDDPSPEESLDEILACVSAEYGVSADELQGPSRNRVVSEARAVIGWLSRRLGRGRSRVWRRNFNESLRRSVDTLEESMPKLGIQINIEVFQREGLPEK